MSADLLRYQLQSWLDWEKYDHYEFPLDQHNGANIWLVTVLSVQHPLRTPKDASNYVARLGLVGTRMAEAVEDAKQRAAKDLIPPRFILNRTIDQMRRFSATPAAQNPLVTAFNERASQIKDLPPPIAPRSSPKPSASSRIRCIPNGTRQSDISSPCCRARRTMPASGGSRGARKRMRFS